MTSQEIREKFLVFFRERGHTIVPSSSLIPDDPSVLLTTAGVQQFKLYYTGDADPLLSIHPNLGRSFASKNVASIQKCFRTSDIDEVGDESHLTFFEMLGNFSFGGYGKKEAIEYGFDFITKEMGLRISYVTIFQGSDAVPKDAESEMIWRTLGISDIREEGIEDVFWGPTGSSGPCGPTTEIYCTNAAGQDVEIWNIVFNEFFCTGSREQLLAGSAKLTPLERKGIDTGMGLERLAMISQNKKNIFETDLFEFAPLLKGRSDNDTRRARIIADHFRGSVFLLADGVRPSNKEVGSVLRRLIRRLLVQWNKLSIPIDRLEERVRKIIEQYGEFSNELKKGEEKILNEFKMEVEKFNLTLEKGLREFDKRYPGPQVQDVMPGQVSKLYIVGQKVGHDAFDLYQTYGFPVEVIRELLEERFYKFDEEEFRKKIDEEFKKHQELSRAGLEKKFGGHGLLLDTGELKAADENELKIVTRLHTATHLLQAALRTVLGPEVNQQGSDITVDRTRFDFSFPRKLTPEEIRQVEGIVNQAIAHDYAVEFREMAYEEAAKSGALHFFRQKYPAIVKVYSVVDSKTGKVFSSEFCGGPHVAHTGEIGHITITKEEASSAGVRRIRASVSL